MGNTVVIKTCEGGKATAGIRGHAAAIRLSAEGHVG